MDKINNLVIGQGAGPVKFLMSDKEVIALLGEPDFRDEDTEDGCKVLTFSYDNAETDFVFEETENGGFALSSLLCTSQDMTLDGKICYGASQEEFMKYAKSLKAAPPQTESGENSDETLCYFDDLGLMAVFTGGVLTGVQIEYWDDEEDE
jgi:hypothetical protein